MASFISDVLALKVGEKAQRDFTVGENPMTLISIRKTPDKLLEQQGDIFEFYIRTPKGRGSCFNMSLNETGKGAVSKIHVHERDYGVSQSCRQYYGLTGNRAIELVDTVSQKMHAKTIFIADTATVRCGKISASSLARGKHKETVSLKTLHMFKQGNTWYGSKGFYPVQTNKSLFLEFTKGLRNFSLARLQRCTKLPPEILVLIDKYKLAFQNDHKIFLKAFMTWVYDHDCHFFDEATTLLRTLKAEDTLAPECKNLDIGAGLALFDRATQNIEKRYDSNKESGSGYDSQIRTYMKKMNYTLPPR